MPRWTRLKRYASEVMLQVRKPAISHNCSGQTLPPVSNDADPRQNLISHRGKALDKLKVWLAGGESEP